MRQPPDMRQSLVAGVVLLAGVLGASGSAHAQRATAHPVMRPVADATPTAPGGQELATAANPAPTRDTAVTPPPRP